MLTPDVVKEISRRTRGYAKDIKEVLDVFADVVAEQVLVNRGIVRYNKLGTFIPRPTKDKTRLAVRYRPPEAFKRQVEQVGT
jgi:nucleoid DNA-binding protein